MILNTITSRDLLIDAYKFYTRGDARAHLALNIIIDRKDNDMTSAVLGCLEQAKLEESVEKQDLYVKAACFGKKFYPGIAIDEFQSTCRWLRVMNICREENIEPTSDLPTITEHLIAKRKFNLAFWIVKWLKDEPQERRILKEWCQYMIDKRHLRDENVAARIQQTFGQNPIVPYAEIANKAIERNRITLAIKLIENEGQSSKQIPLLLSLKQYDRVLVQALATCDSNLIYMAIFKLKDSMPSEIQFLELIKKHKLAFRYYCNFLAITDIQKLIMVAYSEGSKEELTLYLLENRLESALSVSKRTKQDFISHQIESKLRLQKFHHTLKQLEPPPKADRGTVWTDLSISETIVNLIALGHSGKARDCQKRFEIQEKKYKALEQIALNTLPKLVIPTNA